jgi:hypothetical protein
MATSGAFLSEHCVMRLAKPIAIELGVLDSRSRAYMMGHQLLSKQELREALEEAQADPELKGALRSLVIERYKIRIKGESF